MATATKAALRFTVSGPGTDKGYESAAIATSAAITFADHSDGEATFYVRDLDGTVVARVEHDEHGITRTYTLKAAR